MWKTTFSILKTQTGATDLPKADPANYVILSESFIGKLRFNITFHHKFERNTSILFK